MEASQLTFSSIKELSSSFRTIFLIKLDSVSCSWLSLPWLLMFFKIGIKFFKWWCPTRHSSEPAFEIALWRSTKTHEIALFFQGFHRCDAHRSLMKKAISSEKNKRCDLSDGLKVMALVTYRWKHSACHEFEWLMRNISGQTLFFLSPLSVVNNRYIPQCQE